MVRARQKLAEWTKMLRGPPRISRMMTDLTLFIAKDQVRLNIVIHFCCCTRDLWCVRYIEASRLVCAT